MIDLDKVKGVADWPQVRAEIEKAVSSVLRKLPNAPVDLQLKTIDETEYPGYTRRRVNYFVDDWTRVSAWMFVPDAQDEAPGLLCCHGRVPQGKDEPAGITGDKSLALAQHYAQLGFVTIAPDSITAGERVSSGLAPFDTSLFYKDYPKMSAMGKVLWDHMRAIDALVEDRRVDNERIGVIGHGFGGHNALFLVAHDERVQACVASCGFTRFADDKRPERWVGDDGFVYFPEFADGARKGEFPFDWEHILSLAAPSAVLLLTATKDEVWPNTRSCEKAVKKAEKIYRRLGAVGAIENYKHHDGHSLSAASLEKADDWFERWL